MDQSLKAVKIENTIAYLFFKLIFTTNDKLMLILGEPSMEC